MSSKKKRNKPYRGAGAATTKPSVTRVTAVNRNPVHQWWVDHQRVAKPVAIAGGIGAVIIVSVIGIVGLIW